MLGKRSRAAWMAALLTTVVSGAVMTGSAAQATGGDAAAAGTNSFTAKIDIGGVRACTGTLLNNQWVITATRCFADDPALPSTVKAGAPTLKSTVTVGRTDLTDTTGEVRQITQLVPHPDRDIVLAQLDAPVYSISYLHPSTKAPTTGESLLGAGYGRTKDTWVPDQLHTAAFTAGTIADATVEIDGTPVCKGDTGAPVFRTVNGRNELAAVTSLSWQGGCLGSDETRTGAAAIRVDDIRPWITATTTTTAGVWHAQLLTRTTTGLYHSIRDSNGDWTGFGDVQKVAGSIEDIAYAADAAIKGKNYVFAVGGDGHVYEANRRNTGGWDPFRDITPDLGDKPGMTRVAVTSTGTGLALIGLADGRVYHAIQNPDETWTKWGDVSAKLGILGNATQVTVTQTSGGNTHVGVVADKKAYHAVRYSDGTWSDWGRITLLPTAPTSALSMAFAGTGGDLQIVLSTTDGITKHAIRDADGHWSTFGDLTSRLGQQPLSSLAAAPVNGEFQMAAVTPDGTIEHTLRHANGKWDAVDQPTGYPGVSSQVALTGSTQ